MFGSLSVAPIVHEFLAAYPDVTVRLILSDGVIDLVDSHIDVAVRIGSLPNSALVGRRVGDIRWVVCASPEYLRRRGEPRAPADLSNHDCIAFEGLQRYREWPFRGVKTTQQFNITPRFSVNTADGVIGGAVAGVGVARVMCYQAAPSVHEGALVPILRKYEPAGFPVHLVHASQPQHQPLKLRAFLDFVAPRLQQKLREIAAIFEQT
jgi:DNA-binding transcriptional LysR family regulator